MPYTEHPLDAPGIPELLRDLDRAASRADWDATVGLLAFHLCVQAGAGQRVPVMGQGETTRTDDADLVRIVAFAGRLTAGPGKPAANRPRQDLQADRDAAFLETIREHVPTPADAARFFIALSAARGLKLTYDAALARVKRARKIGGFVFTQRGTRFRRSRVPARRN